MAAFPSPRSVTVMATVAQAGAANTATTRGKMIFLMRLLLPFPSLLLAEQATLHCLGFATFILTQVAIHCKKKMQKSAVKLHSSRIGTSLV